MIRDEMTTAAVALIGWFRRATGGTANVEVDRMNDSPIAAERKWWCKVQIEPGTFIIANDHLHPVAAMEDCKAQIIELVGFDAGA